MAQQVLVLGNGFDVSLGIPTKWEDFLKGDEFRSLSIGLQNSLLISSLTEEANLENWVDVECHLKLISSKVTSSSKKDFKDSYRLLSQALYNYIKRVSSNELNRNSQAYNLMKNLDITNTVILDFNYTNTTQIIIGELFSRTWFQNPNIVKVHGTIDDNNIIFGVDDDNSLNLEHNFLKKASKRNYMSLNFLKDIDPHTKITVFGHSLGETDRTYFQSFFSTIQDKFQNSRQESSVELELWHYGEDSYDSLIENITKMSNNNLDRFRRAVTIRTKDSSVELTPEEKMKRVSFLS